jgi:CubicO group peptidase (beta-lactamase class C family)
VKRTAVVLLALGLVAAACSDDESSSNAAAADTTAREPATAGGSMPGTTDNRTASSATATSDYPGTGATAQRGDATVITKESVDAALDDIDGFVDAEMEFFGVPGVAVAVVYDDEVVFSKGYGVREVGTTDPITTDTVFQLASLSKPITATALAGLVAEGVIDWDDPVHQYNPDLVLSDPWVTEHVTFADLYSHRSGLPGGVVNTLEHIGNTRDEILARLRLVPLSPFRTTYSYSNFGMTAAGDAAAKAAGTTFEAMVEDQLFGPAGMTATSASHADFLAQPNRAAIHAKVDGEWVVGPTRQPDAQAPAGGVSSSLEDVSTWVRLVLGGGTLDGDEIIGEEALTETHVPHIVRAPRIGYDAQTLFYGLGWNVENDHLGFLRWGHSGAFSAGAATTAVLLPTEQLGVIVLTNGMPLGIPEIIADEIIDRIATGGVTQNWREVWYDNRFAHLLDEPPELSDQPANPTPPRSNDAYVGTYHNDFYGDVEVVAQGDGLAIIEGPNRNTYPLTHFDGDTFTVVPYSETPTSREPVVFTIGPHGTATQVEILDTDGPGTGVLDRSS